MPNDGYYRNTVEVAGIDPGFLWSRNGDSMTLVDDDQFIEVPYDESTFAYAEADSLPPAHK